MPSHRTYGAALVAAVGLLGACTPAQFASLAASAVPTKAPTLVASPAANPLAVKSAGPLPVAGQPPASALGPEAPLLTDGGAGLHEGTAPKPSPSPSPTATPTVAAAP